jgi:hypothetical protein
MHVLWSLVALRTSVFAKLSSAQRRTSLAIAGFIAAWGDAHADPAARPLNRFEFEGASVWTRRNIIQSPVDLGTRFRLDDLGSGPNAAFRLQYERELMPGHELRAVVAPLVIEERGAFDSAVTFEGETFAAGESIRSKYQFTTYRATYRYSVYDEEEVFLKIGGTVLVRDAQVELESDRRRGLTSNVGVVPLLHLSSGVAVSPDLTILLEGDALAAPQGRAVDFWFGARFNLTENLDVGAGYRFLEGGADNDTIYSFSVFHFATANVGVRF